MLDHLHPQFVASLQPKELQSLRKDSQLISEITQLFDQHSAHFQELNAQIEAKEIQLQSLQDGMKLWHPKFSQQMAKSKQQLKKGLTVQGGKIFSALTEFGDYLNSQKQLLVRISEQLQLQHQLIDEDSKVTDMLNQSSLQAATIQLRELLLEFQMLKYNKILQLARSLPNLKTIERPVVQVKLDLVQAGKSMFKQMITAQVNSRFVSQKERRLDCLKESLRRQKERGLMCERLLKLQERQIKQLKQMLARTKPDLR